MSEWEKKKVELLKIAVIAVAANSFLASGIANAETAEGQQSVECFGINTCKGSNGCGVGKAQIEAAHKAFPGKFAKSQTLDCAGNSGCGAKKGFLAWVKKANNQECLKAGGFLIEKDKKTGALTVVKKNG